MKKTNTKTSVKSEKAVRQKKVIDKTVQDCLKFEEVYDDGLIKVDKDTYSKLYELIDSNFITEPEDKQEDLLVEYTKFVNKFPENVDIILVKEDCVTGTNRIIELASTIADVKGSNRKIENNDLKQNHNFYDINDKRVKNVIKRSTNKGMLKLNLIESFGRIDGLELFNRLEKDFRPRKRV